MPRKKSVNQEAVKTNSLSTNYPIGDPRRYGEAVENSQLSVFDYSGYSEEFKLKSYERKARIKANEQVATKAFYDIAQDVKAQHDDLGNYQEWLKWCRDELDYSKTTAIRLLTISNNLGAYPHPEKLPSSLMGLNHLASALRDSDEETKEEILTAVEEKTEEKGKALTEKEINELPVIKELKEKLKAEQEAKKQAEKENEELKKEKEQLSFDLENTETRIDNVKSYMESQIETKERELKKAQETIANQNKQIQELNSAISGKEQKLIDLSQKERELEEKEQLLAEQENSLNETIDDEVNNKLERLKQQELSNIEEEKQRLKDEQKKIQQELRKQKELAEALENQKQKFNDVRDWLKKIEDFNETLKDRSINIISTIKDIQNLPSFEQLGEDQRKVLFPKFSSAMNEFEKNSEAWGKAIQNIYSALNKADKQVINLINAPIDVEVNE